MRFVYLAAVAALVLSACSKEVHLPDTLKFSPGTPITYRGQAAKLYGRAQCAEGQLTGHSCLIFHPHAPQAKGMVVTNNKVYELDLQARQDPQDPHLFIVEDTQGRHLFRTTGRHDEYANIDIRP